MHNAVIDVHLYHYDILNLKAANIFTIGLYAEMLTEYN